MEKILKIVLLLLFLVYSVASVNVSLTSGELCEGAVATWTCVSDGISAAGWRNLGESGFPPYVSSNLIPLGSRSPFSSTLTCITGTIVTSIATANLTSAVNGSTLDCSDGGFAAARTTISSVTLYLKDSSPVQLVIAKPIGSSLSELVIHICWPKSICAPSYKLNIMSDNGDIYENVTEDTCYRYNVTDIGTYTISVSSIDYFGRMVGDPATTTVHVRPPDIRVIPSFNCHSNIISIIIQDSTDNQLPITSCNIRLMSNDGSYISNDTDCTHGRVFEYTNITCGQSYNYSVTISNVVHSTTEPGTINAVYIEPSVTTVIVATSFCSRTSEMPCPTETPCLSVTPCPEPPECELCLWALIVIIVVGVLFVSAVVFIILELCRRLHCCNVDCWDSIFCNFLFCDCFKKCCLKGKGSEQ